MTTAQARILTIPAFEKYRRSHGPALAMDDSVRRTPGDIDPVLSKDGLREWSDGTKSVGSDMSPHSAPQKLSPTHLWVITTDNVLYALEACEFGAARGAGVLKHSNLTGGGAAISGGELQFSSENDDTLLVNGCSGRYKVRSETEMTAVATAFKESGYIVWTMGYDNEANRPIDFGMTDPKLV